MRHLTTASFWRKYWELSADLRSRADKQFVLLKMNPNHHSLQFKKIGHGVDQDVWSVRVTLNYRALAFKRADGYLWFWIGNHAVYETLI